jgi:hypothetical protein
MDVRRGVAAGLIGLALLAGTTGCSKIGEKVAEEAVEANTDCKDVDIDAGGGDAGFTGTCGNDEISANVGGDAELPSEWPTDLALPDGFQISTGVATGTTVRTLDVVGSVDGDVPTVYETVKTQLAAAGFTIDVDSLAENAPTGAAGTLAATGPVFTAAISVSETVGPLPGTVTVTYSLNSVAG